MKVLLSGAGSFIGTNFLQKPGNFEVSEVCLLQNRVEDIDFRKYDVVLHVAAIVHQIKSIPESEYFRVNSDLAYQVAQKAKHSGVKQFIFISTIKVYGVEETNGLILNEDSLCKPNDYYSASKFDAENRLQPLQDDKFIISIIRTPLVFGPGVKGNMYSLVKLVDHFKILPFGGINNERSLTNVDNLIDIIKTIIITKKPGLFLAGDPEPVSTTKLIRLIAGAFNKKIYLITLPGIFQKLMNRLLPRYYKRLFRSLVFNNSKTRKTLNYVPQYSTEDGIKKMVDWYKSNQ